MLKESRINMSILLIKIHVIKQVYWSEGTFHSEQMIDYGECRRRC